MSGEILLLALALLGLGLQILWVLWAARRARAGAAEGRAPETPPREPAVPLDQGWAVCPACGAVRAWGMRELGQAVCPRCGQRAPFLDEA